MFLLSVLILFLTISLASAAAAPAKDIVPIRLGILESFSVSETPSIEKMRSAYEAALYFAVGENEKRLNACGYSVRLATEYYDNADKLAPKERATYLENSGTYVILGPRRSEQYLVATHGLTRTPIISTAASADDVQNLKPPFFTMFPYIEDFASGLIKALAKERYGKVYGTAYDVTCIACRDFERRFEKIAGQKGYEKRFSIEVSGDVPDLKALRSALKNGPIDFLFMPVYSKAAAYIIASLQKEFTGLKYVGTHSWGDGAYGLLEDYKIDPGVKGLAINSNATPEIMGDIFQVWSLDRESKGGSYGPPSSAYRVIEFIRIMTADLCQYKAQGKRLRNKEDFQRFFASLSPRHFQRRSVFGIFKLENSEYQFAYTVKP